MDVVDAIAKVDHDHVGPARNVPVTAGLHQERQAKGQVTGRLERTDGCRDPLTVPPQRS